MNRFIRNIPKYIYNSVPQRRNERNLYNIEKKLVPFHTLHIDHIGPLPSIKSKRRYILVVIDERRFKEYVGEAG